MKATLKFNLDEPEDVRSHLRCVKSLDMYLVLWELQHNFMRRFKYEEITYDKVSDAINELLKDINIEEL